jgi:hypothetical protein
LPYLPSHDSTNDTAESSAMVVKHSKLLGKETRRTGGRKGPAFAQSGARQAFHDTLLVVTPTKAFATSRQGQSFRGCPRALLLSPHAWLRQVTDSAQQHGDATVFTHLLFGPTASTTRSICWERTASCSASSYTHSPYSSSAWAALPRPPHSTAW